MLDLIPREILLSIIDQIPHNRDRNSISQVSKKLYALVLPTLYESIIITSKDEFNLEQTDIDKFLRPANLAYFTTVKSISFLAPTETNDQFRCIHFKLLHEADRDATDDSNDELVSRVDNLGGLMPQIKPLFQGLQDNHLRSFHWHLGTCVPKDILGPGGYLPTRQRGIEDLSLITGDPCVLPKKDWEYQISLTEFKSLKKFCWSGGLSREYFHALRDMLRTQSTNLEVFKIDLIDWWDAQWNWCANDYELQLWIRENNFFGERVLGIAPGGTQVLFPSLKSLSFSSVQFRGALEMTHAFSISKLRSLNLRECPRVGSLLRKVVESGEPIHLRSLELVIRHNSDDSYRKEEDEDWIEPFLNSFEGLTNLNLLVLNGKSIDTRYQYWPSIFHHKKTLTRIVYHERRFYFIWDDCNTDMGSDDILHLFTQMSLECIGLCLSPLIPSGQIFSQLTVAQVTNLKFLCLRTTLHSEHENPVKSVADGIVTIYQFANWAFHTFPHLLFIASGDFSHGRSGLDQEILHRHPFPGVDSNDEPPGLQPVQLHSQPGFDGFRPMRTGDYRFLHHLEQFRDVLEACPAEPLYRKDF